MRIVAAAHGGAAKERDLLAGVEILCRLGERRRHPGKQHGHDYCREGHAAGVPRITLHLIPAVSKRPTRCLHRFPVKLNRRTCRRTPLPPQRALASKWWGGVGGGGP